MLSSGAGLGESRLWLQEIPSARPLRKGGGSVPPFEKGGTGGISLTPEAGEGLRERQWEKGEGANFGNHPVTRCYVSPCGLTRGVHRDADHRSRSKTGQPP